VLAGTGLRQVDARTGRVPEPDAGAVRVALEPRPAAGDGYSTLVRIHLENGTAATVTGTIVMLAAEGVLGEEYPLRLVVAARDSGTVDVTPSLANGIRATRLVVRVRGGAAFDVDLAVPEPLGSAQLYLPSHVGRRAQPEVPDAPWLLPIVSPPTVLPASVPRRALVRSRPFYRYAILTVGVGCAAAGTTLAALALLRPNVAELSVPTPVARDSHVDIAYRLAGFGTARYRVTDADGTPIDAADLAARSGTFRVQIPASLTGRPLTVDVDVAGPFGAAHRAAALAVIATPAPAAFVRAVVAPHIAMLGVDRAAVSPGDDVTVTYDVSPPHGQVLLADALGDILAAAPVTPAGVAKLHVPAKEQLGDVAVVVRTDGATPAESRIPLHILASPLPSEAATAQLLVDASALTIQNRRVQSASPIVVHIGEPYDGLHLSLVDAKFDAVAKVDVAPGRTDAAIIAPAVSAPTQYTLEATIEHGAESSTSIYPVVVVPGRT
jgi:hypothetical protein